MKNKIIILGTLGTLALTASIVLPIVLKNKDEEKTIKKDTVLYANKLKTFVTNTITIDSISGDVKTNKNAILNKIKSLGNFPKIPNGISLDIKDSSEELTISGVSVILIIKKDGQTNLEIEGLKVKRREYTPQEKQDLKIIEDYKEKILKNIKPKNRIIRSATNVGFTGSITDNKAQIISEFKETILISFLTIVIGIHIPSGVSFDIEDDSRQITSKGIEITLIIKKGQLKTKFIDNWYNSFIVNNKDSDDDREEKTPTSSSGS